MSISIIPKGDAVLIRQREANKVTASGLHIPDTAQERSNSGEVIAVGPGRVTNHGVRVPCECAVGETVVWDKYQGTEISEFYDDGNRYWLVREDVITGHGKAES